MCLVNADTNLLTDISPLPISLPKHYMPISLPKHYMPICLPKHYMPISLPKHYMPISLPKQTTLYLGDNQLQNIIFYPIFSDTNMADTCLTDMTIHINWYQYRLNISAQQIIVPHIPSYLVNLNVSADLLSLPKDHSSVKNSSN